MRVGFNKTDEKQYLYELKIDDKEQKLWLGRQIPLLF